MIFGAVVVLNAVLIGYEVDSPGTGALIGKSAFGSSVFLNLSLREYVCGYIHK